MNLHSLGRRAGRALRGAGGTARFLAHLHLTRATPIIVYQMGKVGSTSVLASLLQNGFDCACGMHRMSPENIQAVRQFRLARHREVSDERIGQWVYSHIVKKRKPAKVITLVREPISRNMSAFFQNFQVFMGTEWLDSRATSEDLLSSFIAEYSHSVPLTWFDVEMRQTVGIDVYEHPFPKEIGYHTIRQDCFELLILKLELDDVIKEEAIAKFLDVDEFHLVQANVGRQKDYAKGYREFLQTATLPQSYVEILCESRYMNHFYSEAEIEAVRLRWRDRVHSRELPPAVREQLLRASAREVREP